MKIEDKVNGNENDNLENYRLKVIKDLREVADYIEENKEINVSDISEELVELIEKNRINTQRKFSDIGSKEINISNAELVNEIQRLRTLADLLSLYGAVKDDNAMTKKNINEQILAIIIDNFLYEFPSIYNRVRNS